MRFTTAARAFPGLLRNWKDALVILLLLLAANAIIWIATLITFRHFAILLVTATLAWTFGLRHALDADHISAIDNVTRKLMQDGRRPLLVGFFFSLGHSTIVILLSAAIAVTAPSIQARFPGLQHYGGLVGTSVSAFFLVAIAGVNLLILRNIRRTLAQVKRGEPFREDDIDTAMGKLGFLGRIFRPIVRMVNRSWKMYFVGFLFGLGFDTATEVGVLGISAVAASQGLPTWTILLFPLLFTAGMCLFDTADGLLMLGIYGWAYVHPIRKLYYNMTITAVSVLFALVVGGIEAMNVLGDQLSLHGPFWSALGSLGNHFGAIGVGIIALFVAAWAVSAISYRWLGYRQLEIIGSAIEGAAPVASPSLD